MESRLNWLMICAMVSLCDSSDKITPTSGTSNFSCRRKSASRKRTRKICVNDIYNVLVKFLYSPTRRQVSFMTLSDAKLILTKENARITDVNWHQVTPTSTERDSCTSTNCAVKVWLMYVTDDLQFVWSRVLWMTLQLEINHEMW